MGSSRRAEHHAKNRTFLRCPDQKLGFSSWSKIEKTQTKYSMSPVKKISSMNDNFLVHLPSVHPSKVISSKKKHPDDFRHHVFAGNWPEK